MPLSELPPRGSRFGSPLVLSRVHWVRPEMVLPFFKRMESYAGEGDDAFRGREGPLRVTNPEPRDPLFATIIKAAAQVGIRQPGLQRRQPGGHRDETGDDCRRPPHEHGALLSRSGPQPPEPAY